MPAFSCYYRLFFDKLSSIKKFTILQIHKHIMSRILTSNRHQRMMNSKRSNVDSMTNYGNKFNDENNFGYIDENFTSFNNPSQNNKSSMKSFSHHEDYQEPSPVYTSYKQPIPKNSSCPVNLPEGFATMNSVDESSIYNDIAQINTDASNRDISEHMYSDVNKCYQSSYRQAQIDNMLKEVNLNAKYLYESSENEHSSYESQINNPLSMTYNDHAINYNTTRNFITIHNQKNNPSIHKKKRIHK